MSRTLADLRANPPKSRAERSATICLAPKLVAEVQALAEELDSLPSPPTSDGDGERSGPPKRLGQGQPPRALEIRTRMGQILEEMTDHEGELRLRANLDDGEWRRWADAHPGREKDEKGHARDQEVTFGYCNADDLIDALGDFAHSWNGEELAEGDWAAVFAESVASGDKKTLATAVVTMYETNIPFRRWASGLRDSLGRLNASDSPATSESATSDSTAGSPDLFSGDSTATATAAP